MSLFRMGSMEFSDILIMVAARVFILLCVLPIHEYAHALIATKLGDQTARLSGRLTASPFAHLDLWGSLMIILFGFGYAKPVPVNPNNFKNPKSGMAITAIAGPVSNLLMSFIFMLVYNCIATFGASLYVKNQLLFTIILSFISFAAQINVSLAVFNLLPIPPLDGSRLLTVFLPTKYYFKVMQYERQIMIVMMILIFTGALTTPLSYLSNWVFRGLANLASLPF